MSAPYLSVVVPAYNEEINLAETVPAVQRKLDALDVAHEIIVVDDGSTDRTAEVAHQLAARDPRVRVAVHPENRGPGSGVFTGIELAEGRFVMFIPADLAMDLDHLHKYLDASRDADLVVGLRSDRRDYTLARKLVSYTNIFLIRMLFGMKQRQFNYIHCYRRSLLRQVNIETRGVFITAEIMIKAHDLDYRLVEVEIPYVPRTAGVASCGRASVIAKTVRDLLRIWLKRTFRPRLYRATLYRQAA